MKKNSQKLPLIASDVERFENALSYDGYIRLRYTQLQREVLKHFVSGLDENTNIVHDSVTYITGYTEWVSLSMPIISIGWDWQLGTNYDSKKLILISDVRSNVMLQTESNTDYNLQQNNILLEKFVDNFDWQNLVKDYTFNRYKN